MLNSQAHGRCAFKPGPPRVYGDNQRFVQVVVAEFSHLVLHYPILLSKDSETGAFFCGAMLGL